MLSNNYYIYIDDESIRDKSNVISLLNNKLWNEYKIIKM